MTVTGTWLPSSPKTWVMPTLRPMSPSYAPCRALELDFNVHSGGQIQLHERVDSLGRGVHDVEQPLVGAHLELLARGLVDVGAPQHGPAVDDGREQHGARDARAGPPHGLDDLLDRPIEELMVVRLEADPDLLVGGHGRHVAT